MESTTVCSTLLNQLREILETNKDHSENLKSVNETLRQACRDVDKNATLLLNSDTFLAITKHIYYSTKAPLQRDGGYFHDDDLNKHKDTCLLGLEFFNVAIVFFKAMSSSDRNQTVSDVNVNKLEINEIQLLVYGLLLAGEHRSELSEWSDIQSVTAGKSLEKSLCEAYNCTDIAQLLTVCLNGKQCFHHIMEQVKVTTKQDGIKSLGTLYAFQYFLCNFNESLSDYISVVFPTCLVLIDDYRPENKVRGITCLRQVIHKCASSEMKAYGRSQVIYEALHKLLYTNEVDLLSVVLPTMLDILKVECEMPLWVETFRTVNKSCEKLHEVTGILLRNMEMENKVSVMRVYSENLTSYITALGIQAVQHYHRIFSTIYSYLEVHDGRKQTNLLNALTALEALITQTWPRIATYSCEILRNVFKLVVDITDGCLVVDAVVVDEVLQGCSNCLHLLHSVDQETVTSTLSAVAMASVNDKTVTFCKQQLKQLTEEV